MKSNLITDSIGQKVDPLHILHNSPALPQARPQSFSQNTAMLQLVWDCHIITFAFIAMLSTFVCFHPFTVHMPLVTLGLKEMGLNLFPINNANFVLFNTLTSTPH